MGFIWNGSEGEKWKWEKKKDKQKLGFFFFCFIIASALSLSFLVVMMECGGAKGRLIFIDGNASCSLDFPLFFFFSPLFLITYKSSTHY